MRRMTPVMLVGAVILGYLAGYMMSPVGSASGQTASQPPAWTTVPLAPNQGETVYWSIDDLRQAHTELAARVANGQPVGSPPRSGGVADYPYGAKKRPRLGRCWSSPPSSLRLCRLRCSSSSSRSLAG